ncbi:hypothetical protein T12_155 [Trichinella patagoniensis]|uniref:Uncharacterized protein n=1 Tax=Trichinella patagoniensis TaxID=990121 RepID=A0A0V0YV64_9BILA|nr:hypothetical protein T12_155 [Trichinella patagoniensis]
MTSERYALTRSSIKVSQPLVDVLSSIVSAKCDWVAPKLRI